MGNHAGGHTYTCLVYLGPVRTFTRIPSCRIDVVLISCLLEPVLILSFENASIYDKRCFGKGPSCRDA